MGNHDIARSLIVQILPIAIILRLDRYESGVVLIAAVLHDKEHLSGATRKTGLGRAYQILGILGIVHCLIDHHHS